MKSLVQILSLILAAILAMTLSAQAGNPSYKPVITFTFDGPAMLHLSPSERYEIVMTPEKLFFVRILDIMPDVTACDHTNEATCIRLQERICADFVPGAWLGYYKWGEGKYVYEGYECYLPFHLQAPEPYDPYAPE